MQAAPSNGPTAKKNIGLRIALGCIGLTVLSCCCLTGIGIFVANEENRSVYTPGVEVSRAPLLVMGTPQPVVAVFQGDGYGFAQIFADIEAQQIPGANLLMTGEVTCAGYPSPVDIMVWDQNARVSGYSRSGDRVTAQVLVHDEYMRAGELARTCTATLQVTGGTVTSGSLVVRNYQRLGDRFAD